MIKEKTKIAKAIKVKFRASLILGEKRMKTFRILGFILLVVVALFSGFEKTVKGDESNACSQDAAEKSRLIEKAENEQYNVRHITILGSTYTRYRTFRKQWDESFEEGSIFTRKSLMKSIEGTNKLKTIEPIDLDDVRVRLEENDVRGWNAVDFDICVEQK